MAHYTPNSSLPWDEQITPQSGYLLYGKGGLWLVSWPEIYITKGDPTKYWELAHGQAPPPTDRYHKHHSMHIGGKS